MAAAAGCAGERAGEQHPARGSRGSHAAAVARRLAAALPAAADPPGWPGTVWCAAGPRRAASLGSAGGIHAPATVGVFGAGRWEARAPQPPAGHASGSCTTHPRQSNCCCCCCMPGGCARPTGPHRPQKIPGLGPSQAGSASPPPPAWQGTTRFYTLPPPATPTQPSGSPSCCKSVSCSPC